MTQIETASELTCLYGEPTVLAKKNLDHIDTYARALIERSPFLVLSTADAQCRLRSPERFCAFRIRWESRGFRFTSATRSRRIKPSSR